MIRRGDRALRAEVIPITARTGKLVHLEFDRTGAIRSITTTEQPADRQTDAELAATRLVQDVGHRLRQVGDLARMERQLQLMLDLVQNLRALEDQHCSAAAALFSEAAGA